MRQPYRSLVLVVVCLFLVASPLHVFGQEKVLADTGFRPEQNGFSFENYTNDNKPTNLTPETVHELFGNQACKTISNGNCILSASAEAWMNSINNEMGGGHCEGMAALSSLIFSGKVKLADLDPNAKSVSDLNPNDPKVQAEIAKWWATQTVDPTAAAEIKETPNDIVNLLVQNMQPGTSPFTMGITQPNGEGGHAITPYSVLDMGNGQVRIMVYDNNYPGKERWIDV